jgi:type IV pilus assembly protein PilW
VTRTHASSRRRVSICGLTLIELVVAMAIACTIIAGVLGLYAQTSGTYRVNERIARLQEQGRFALSVMEPDVELAGYYGFTNVPEAVRLVRGASPDTTIATAAQLRQFAVRAGDAPPPAVTTLPSGAHTCGVNFAVDVMLPVQGSNDAFLLGRNATCKAYQSRPREGSDTLTLRRVATEASVPEAGRIQIYASRLTSRTHHLMFTDGNAPGAIDADHRVRDLLVRTYYVARDSVGQSNFPALRVKALTKSGAGVAFDDEEVMPGIEDLQVQFGVDARATGSATRYVNPDFEELPSLQVVSVRIWVRVRADEPETGFDDARTYRYANVEYTPTGAERRFRRVLMSRTVTLRNARTG